MSREETFNTSQFFLLSFTKAKINTMKKKQPQSNKKIEALKKL